MSERDVAGALHGVANDNSRGPVSLEAIEQDPWHAVDRSLPQDADRGLLEQVTLAAGECAKAAVAAARVAAITDPDRVEPYGARRLEAAERWHEARRALRELDPEQVSDVSPFPDPARLQERAVIGLMIEMGEERGSQPRSPVTADAIDNNPWSIVRSDLSGADPDLLSRVRDTAVGLIREAMDRRDGRSHSPEEASLWNAYVEAARDTYIDAHLELSRLERPAGDADSRTPERGEELAMTAERKLALQAASFDITEADAPLREAWRAPAFSRETIEIDPWTAVYRPIPADGDVWLLMKGFDAAHLCEDRIARGEGPRLRQGDDGPAESMERAVARAAEIANEIERRLEAARKPEPATSRDPPLSPAGAPEIMAEMRQPDPSEALTREAIARDPWNAVSLEIPADADRELLSLITMTARDLRHGLSARANTALREDDVLEFLQLGSEAKERQQDAESRLAELDGVRERFRNGVAELMLDEWRNGFDADEQPQLSPGWIGYDPWRAVTAPLPRDASPDFLNLVADAAWELAGEAEQRSLAALNAADARDWRDIAGEAGRRLGDVQHRLETLRAVERTPEMDLTVFLGETAYRAVNDAIPRGADGETLERLSEDVEHAIDRLDDLYRSRHATTIPASAISEQIEKANARLGDIEERLERTLAAGIEPGREPAPDIARGVVTAEAIERDPWNAVRLELPREMSAEMAGLVVETAQHLRDEAVVQFDAADTGAEKELWLERREDAEERRLNALNRYHEAIARVAWEAPAFSRETIDADPWTAVYLPMPEDAARELLQYARSWVNDLTHYAGNGGLFAEPSVDPGRYPEERHVEAATARLVEIEERIELSRDPGAGREEFTLEDVRGDPWAAIDKEIPRDADAELLTQARTAAGYCVESLAWDIQFAGARDDPAHAAGDAEARYEKAAARLDELDQRIDPPRALELDRDRAMVETREARSDFLSPSFIGRGLSEHAARTMDLVLNVLVGYFVSEPELTPQQLHDLARANEERAENRAYHQARGESAAALDEVNLEIERHRSPVHGGRRRSAERARDGLPSVIPASRGMKAAMTNISGRRSAPFTIPASSAAGSRVNLPRLRPCHRRGAAVSARRGFPAAACLLGRNRRGPSSDERCGCGKPETRLCRRGCHSRSRSIPSCRPDAVAGHKRRACLDLLGEAMKGG